MKKNDYLLDLYYSGEDTRDPETLPSWFSGLVFAGFVKCLKSDRVIITKEGLKHVEDLGLVPTHPIHVARNEHFQALLTEALGLFCYPEGPVKNSLDQHRSELLAELASKLSDCKELAKALQ